MKKRAFDINAVVRRIRKAVAGFPDAAMFALREQGYGTVFQQLVACTGVGPKCANLALGVAAGVARISVDVHVWRVVYRWGYVAAPTPEKTEQALARVLPKRYWIEINRLLVPFGKHVCTGVRPKCSLCPVLEYCRQVGVTEHR